jgi:hypothetical protein
MAAGRAAGLEIKVSAATASERDADPPGAGMAALARGDRLVLVLACLLLLACSPPLRLAEVIQFSVFAW